MSHLIWAMAGDGAAARPLCAFFLSYDHSNTLVEIHAIAPFAQISNTTYTR